MIYILLALFLVLFIVVFVFSFFFSLLSGVLSWLGIGKKKTSGSDNTRRWAQKDNARAEKHGDTSVRKKLFADDEGEYVDFEEIK
jgi:hypothetical protein